MLPPSDPEALIAAGKYAEAAARLRQLGDLGRAQALYEKIWDFRAAAEIARERGDRPALLRLLLDARDFAEAARVGEVLQRAAPEEQARAAEVYERRRMWAEAATLREAEGALELAHQLYLKAQQPLEAARIDETRGRLREAGLLYEQFLAGAGMPDRSDSAGVPRAQLELGRILFGFGRHEDAARHLQQAVLLGDDELAKRARRLLVPALAELGYRDAAAAVLARLPEPGNLDFFLARERQVGRKGAEAAGTVRLAGRYRMGQLLGSGSMGRVYLAWDELTSEEVAVKVVAAPVDARSRDGYARFVREARVVSSLKHPNIVAVLDFQEELGVLAMEFMAGGTLAERLAAPLSPAAVRSLTTQLLDALEAAHAHGVIHRDIKPANIFFDGSGQAKLGDFGVAHLQDLGTTQTAGFIGTLAYMSPEQISGAPLTFAADVYALGVTLFQALTGRLPFSGPDFVGQHLGQAPPSPSSFQPSLDRQWDLLVGRALEKDPEARFASLDELRRLLLLIPAERQLLGELVRADAAEPPHPVPSVRYANTGLVGETTASRLESALDTRLGREVVIERFRAGYLETLDGALHLAWLKAMARHGGPGLQRILSIDHAADGARVVYEVVRGSPLSSVTEASVALAPDEARRLARALAPVHAEGIAHGAVLSSVVREETGPTLLVAGRAPSGGSRAADDADLATLTREADDPSAS